MTALTKQELKSLMALAGPVCVSLYVPTARVGRETLQNPTRLKSVLREASRLLAPLGENAGRADRLLAPAAALLDEREFWQHRDEGLALFLTEGAWRGYTVPYPVREAAFVSDRFHVKPLLPLLCDDGVFFVLAVSGNDVRLFRASRYVIDEVTLEGVPRSEAEALRFDDPEKSLQVHSGPRGGPSGQPGIVHGQGAAKENAKDRTLRFFRLVDASLRPYLRDERRPLVLAGVKGHLPVYTEANTYPHLVPDIVASSPEAVPADELHRAAWAKVEPMFRESRERAVAAIEQGLSRGAATSDLGQAVAAACHGRAAACVVALDAFCSGRYIEESATIELLAEETPRSVDLVDLAAVETVLHGGDAFPVASRSDVPGGGPIAALMFGA